MPDSGDDDMARKQALVRLRQRSVTYRWLWCRHNAVEALLRRGRSRAWITLAGLAAEDGLTLKRETLRASWPKVHDDWLAAEHGLRAAPVSPEMVANIADPPLKSSERSERRFFSDISDNLLVLPDITGKKT